MEIILHIGAHRTATTTFQGLLAQNEARLLSLGIAAWTPKTLRAGRMAGLIHRPSDVTPDIEAMAKRSRSAISAELEDLSHKGIDRVIVSEENLMGAVRNNLRVGALYPDLAERLVRIRAAFKGYRVRVVMNCRSYVGYWSSALAFGVGAGHRMPDTETIDRLVSSNRGWADLAREVSEVMQGAPLAVAPYGTLCRRPDDLLMAMLSQELETPIAGAQDWRNAAPRLGRLRRLLTDRGDLKGADQLPAGDGRWMPFSGHQQDQLAERYAHDLAALSRLGPNIHVLETLSQGAKTAAALTQDVMGDADRTGRYPPLGGHDNGRHPILD